MSRGPPTRSGLLSSESRFPAVEVMPLLHGLRTRTMSSAPQDPPVRFPSAFRTIAEASEELFAAVATGQNVDPLAPDRSQRIYLTLRSISSRLRGCYTEPSVADNCHFGACPSRCVGIEAVARASAGTPRSETPSMCLDMLWAHWQSPEDFARPSCRADAS